MPENHSNNTSLLLKHLPSIYQEDTFLCRFLLAFEKVLLGRADQVLFEYKGLEEIIANIASLFEADKTPEGFLEWLASWTALSLRADLSVEKQREFIANIVQLYKNRGTKQNLWKLLHIFLEDNTGLDITEPGAYEMQIGEHATIGEDTYLGGGPPHFFCVTIAIREASPELLARQQEIARALIDLEKPAHTYYDLKISFLTMQIGVRNRSQIGVSTLLGTDKG